MSRREFSVSVKKAAWARAAGICECGCDQPFTDHPKERPHYDHILPDALGGEPTLENCKVIRVCCHLVKTGTYDMPKIAKARRGENDRRNIKAKSRKIAGSKDTPFKKKLDGTVERREG